MTTTSDPNANTPDDSLRKSLGTQTQEHAAATSQTIAVGDYIDGITWSIPQN